MVSNALVLRGGSRIISGAFRYRYGRYVRAARAGAYVARAAYRNRRSIGVAYRGLRNVTLRRRRRVRMTGSPHAGPANQAWYLTDGTVSQAGRASTISLQRKTAWFGTVQIAKPPSGVELLGQPARNQIKLKGIKVCLNAELQSFLVADTCMFHFALIQPKGFDTQVAPLDLDSFFARPGGGTPGLDRTENFVQFAADPSVNWDYNCNGINREKWNIITHVKRRIHAKGDAYAGGGSSIFCYEKYFDMKKTRIMWDSINSTFQTRPLVAICWFERLTSDSVAGVNTMNLNINTKAFFSDSV